MAGQLIDANPRKIKWTRSLIAHLARGREGTFDSVKIGKVAYRPYCQSWIYYDPQFNEYYKEKLYPTSRPKNLAIQATGAGGNKDFSCLISDLIFDVQTLSNGQCFPLYWYEKAGEKKLNLASSLNKRTMVLKLMATSGEMVFQMWR
jgi:predicted helicase